MKHRNGSTRTMLFFVLVLACLFAAPAISQAATRTVDASGGTDAGDCTASDCQHIQYAIDQSNAGDTILVNSGTYDTEPNDQVVIDKGLTLTGAGIGQSIIDGNNLTAGSGTLRIATATSDPVKVTGFTVREPATNGYGIFAKATAPLGASPTYTLRQIAVTGLGPGGHDYNFYTDGSTADLEIANSTFTNADFNPVLIERQVGSLNFHDNQIIKTAGTTASSAFFDMNHGPTVGSNPSGFAEAHRVADNTITANGNSGIVFNARPTFGGPDTTGGFKDVTITGNVVNNSATGVSISNDSADPDGSDAEVRRATISNNDLNGGTGNGINIRGLVSHVLIERNDLRNRPRGILFANSLAGSHAPGTSEVHLNRFLNNDIAAITKAAAAGNVDAENNYFGCNQGPSSPPCAQIGLPGIDFDPWIVIGLSASPGSIEVGGATAAVVADGTQNSDGQSVPNVFDGGDSVAFGTDLGSIDSPKSFSSGIAVTTLTSGPNAGTATVSASVDNPNPNAIPTTTVTFTDSNAPQTTITAGPADGSRINNPAPTFEFGSDDPNATFDCTIDGGAPSSCSSPFTASALPDGPHTFSVAATDVNNNTDGSPATRSFTVDTTAPQATITSGPAEGSTVQDDSPSFSFTSNEPNSTFECKLDDSAFGSCSSPLTTPNLSEGQHTFVVQATDAANNTGTPASRTFTVDAADDAEPAPAGPQPGVCRNYVRGTTGNDLLLGSRFGDRMYGRNGNDTMRGRGGKDCLIGGVNSDTLIGGPGVDRFKGRAGRDKIQAADGAADRVRCGSGRDVAVVDRIDFVRGCEVVRVR